MVGWVHILPKHVNLCLGKIWTQPIIVHNKTKSRKSIINYFFKLWWSPLPSVTMFFWFEFYFQFCVSTPFAISVSRGVVITNDGPAACVGLVVTELIKVAQRKDRMSEPFWRDLRDWVRGQCDGGCPPCRCGCQFCGQANTLLGLGPERSVTRYFTRHAHCVQTFHFSVSFSLPVAFLRFIFSFG